MKKVVVMFLVMVLILTGCAAGGVSQEEYDELTAEYAELAEEYDSLKESNDRLVKTWEEIQPEYQEYLDWKMESVSESTDTMDLLPYKLFYDALVQELRGNEYDWEEAVSEVAEEYGLSEVEKLTLISNAEWLVTMVSALSGGE